MVPPLVFWVGLWGGFFAIFCELLRRALSGGRGKAGFCEMTPKRQGLFLNHSGSLLHSILVSLCVFFIAHHHYALLKDPSVLGPLPHVPLLAHFSLGYFVHDVIHMTIYGLFSHDPFMLPHHILVGTGLVMCLLTGRYHGMLILGLFAEANSVFLHARMLLRMLNRQDTKLYRGVLTGFWMTWLLCRMLPHLYGAYLSFTIHSLHPWVKLFGLVTGVAINTGNVALARNLWCAENRTRDPK